MSNPFRKSYQLLEQNEGEYINGTFVQGTETLGITIASAQPVTGKELETLSIGQRELGKIKIYTDDVYNVSNYEDKVKGDVFIFNGDKYEIISVQKWQSGIINHYKYYAEMRGVYS